MKNFLFLSVVFLSTSILLMAQKPIKLFKETKKLSNGLFQLIEKNKKGDTLVIGFLSSINPEVRNGEFIFYNSNKIIEAKGLYSENIPSGIWNYYDNQGNAIKTVNYDKTIKFLNSDTIKFNEEYLLADVMPDFQGNGFIAFKKYIYENLVYPIYAYKKNITDKVMIQFTIDENGKVSKVHILQSLGDLDLNMEAMRIVSESPLWKPGIIRNTAVPVVITFPITFKIE